MSLLLLFSGGAGVDASRALRNVRRHEGLTTEAEHREIALRREKQGRLAALNILREQLEEARRQELALRPPEPVVQPRKAREQPAPIIVPPDPAIEQRRIAALAKVRADTARIEAAALRETDDIRRLEANLLRIEMEQDDDEDAVLLIAMMM